MAHDIDPQARGFASRTGADSIKAIGAGRACRIEYKEDSGNIIQVGDGSDVPDGYSANLSFGPTPTIDLFPRS